jgi:septum formation protein
VQSPSRLVLASSSRYRRMLLNRLKVPFDVDPADIDELSWHATVHSSDELACQLAFAKAECVLKRNPDAVVIGSDQLVDLDGQILGKPGTRENAIEQILQMSGRCHRLLTAVCVLWSSAGADSPAELEHYEKDIFLNETRLRMRNLSRQEAERYVDADQPLDCAGSYKIEEYGIALFDQIECSDFTAITGLPLIRLAETLRRLNFAIP